ncbi:MAG: amidohydrolase family protein [bacterium]|nr:amidohydrolase family protein [Acidimicrobiia bacterium]MCY4649577.1 amidohydrolase family protein [bacterium]
MKSQSSNSHESHPSRLALVPDLLWNPPDQDSQSGKALLISGGQIDGITDAKALPGDVDRMTFPGCTLLPGLIDAHTHLASWMIPALLAAGVTTVRDIGNDLDWILGLRRRLDADPRPTPRIRCCGPVLDGEHVNWPLLGEPHATAEAVDAKIDLLAAAGVDEIKLYVHLNLEQVRAAATAGRRNHVPVVAHLGGVNALEAARAGVAELQHLSGIIDPFDGAHLVDLEVAAKTLTAADTALCPTVVVWDRLARLSHFVSRPDPRLRWVPDEVRQAWDAFPHRHDPEGSRGRMAAIEEIERVIPVFYRAGVSIIVGTDAPWPYLIPGFSFHDELVILHRAGLTPAQVLTAATREASLRLGVDHLTGTLEEGKAADLLIAAGNPLSEIEDIRRVREVFRGGQRVDVARLEPGEFHPGDPVNASLLAYAEGISRPK